MQNKAKVYMDRGPKPFVANIQMDTQQNNTFRTAIWTGEHLQITVMAIRPGGDIGLEMHPNTDQFLRIESGYGRVMMGPSQDNLDYQRNIRSGSGIVIPAGYWHNLVNTGMRPIKLYSIYAPPNHPHGTVHHRKEDEAEHN